jgi:cytochrome c oxidase accessory protein FixG
MNAFNKNEISIQQVGSVTEIYREFEGWNVNTGTHTIHAKRMSGFFRTLKNYTHLSLWLPFFLLPYLRWDDKQAILFDINHSQFRFFNVTVLPDDIWMLALVLLAAAMVLFAATTVASRVWCGYFCFQTAWTDWFTWIEEKIEGNPAARRKLEEASWGIDKVKKKTAKHAAWMALALITGISFSIWFVDAFEYWNKLIHLQLPKVSWLVIAMFFFGTYILAGFLREQACFWLCPYARIQGVLTDAQTVMPSYDIRRGEPRGKLRRNGAAVEPQGDCIDCYQCVQVCPTGVDIRKGLQLGCITCGLCLDACDSIMDKIGKPRGLIRYASLDEMENRPAKKPYQHKRNLVYVSIILLSLGGIVYGLTHMSSMNLIVTPERQPMFVRMSDGAIQNKYDFKVQNKTGKDMYVNVTAEGDIPGQTLISSEMPIFVSPKRGATFTVFVKAPGKNIAGEITPIRFRAKSVESPDIAAEYETYFNGPGV